jgi:MSHA type pilus biogenesis protein MshL
VTLSDKFEQGIDWSIMPTGSAGTKLSITPPTSDSTGGLTVSGYNIKTDTASALKGVVLKGVGVIAGSVRLLEGFGTVKVLSSPKISVLNNQTAMLKVVNNYVYFNIASNTTNSTTGPSQTTVTTTPQSVSIGLVMSVTPQISDNDIVLLNVRPTISSLFGPGKKDPNPSIPQGLENIVPEIQTREMESMLRLSNGEIAIMGGLMEDKVDNSGTSVPGLGDLPGIGALFGARTDKRTKTELVIFLRPTIIRDASMTGDYREFKSLLPEDSFLENGPETKYPSFRPYENKRP